MGRGVRHHTELTYLYVLVGCDRKKTTKPKRDARAEFRTFFFLLTFGKNPLVIRMQLWGVIVALTRTCSHTTYRCPQLILTRTSVFPQARVNDLTGFLYSLSSIGKRTRAPDANCKKFTGSCMCPMGKGYPIYAQGRFPEALIHGKRSSTWIPYNWRRDGRTESPIRGI